MNFVEGFSTGEVVYMKEEAAKHFYDQEKATDIPYIYLSAGVSTELFQDTLLFAAKSGSKFNGVLCGRATLAGVVPIFIEQGEEDTRKWLRTSGLHNINELNKVLEKTDSPLIDNYR